MSDPDGIGAVMHPPANFSIGVNKGYLCYYGQPSYHRACFRYGHTKEDCLQGTTCRNCKKSGHEASVCPFSPLCDMCRASDHTCRTCPGLRRQHEKERAVKLREIAREIVGDDLKANTESETALPWVARWRR